MKDYQREFGAYIKKLRKEKGYSQDKFAEFANLTPAYLSALERGIANPRLDTIKKLANGLNLPVADLFIFESCLSQPKELRDRLIELLQNTGEDSLERLCSVLLATLLKK